MTVTDHTTARGHRTTTDGVAGADDLHAASRAGGWVTIAGALIMLGGAVCHGAFGADLFAVMEPTDRSTVAEALSDVAKHHSVLAIGTFLWILGACAMSLGGTLIVRSSTSQWAATARWAFAAASGAAIVFFAAMVGIIERLAAAHARGEDVITLAQVVGKGAAAADEITTTLILGVGYAAVVFSGRSSWAPRWLQYLAATSLAVGMAGIVAYAGDSVPIGYLLLPVGFATVFSAGVMAVRNGR